MKVGIVSRLDLKNALKLSKDLVKRLSAERTVLDKALAEKLDVKGVPIDRMDIDSLIVIGGDGTILRTHQKRADVPILGINMGGRGFLTEVDPEDAFDAVDRMMKGKLDTVGQIKLAIEGASGRFPDALNEGVISGEKLGKGTLPLKIWVDKEEVEKIEGDGVIVATPTGSTAYALSAGGPVVDPRLEALLVVPISVPRPRVLPLVLPSSSEIEVELMDPDRDISILIDGQIPSKTEEGNKILFRRSESRAKFYKWRKGFYEKTRGKL